MERIRFIDRIDIDLFDLYWEYLEEPRFNIGKIGDSYDELWFDNPTIYQQE